MKSPPHSGPWAPETEAERIAIRAQLDRLLASPLFKNSKRYPNLLKFVVERALDGHAEPLKERTLGIEVFGRDPDYDTNLDPVVRTTAVEIRKRIAQYYREPGHETEIRIDFPSGSYVPEFRIPAEPLAGVAPAQSAPAPARRTAILATSAAAVIVLAGVLLLTKPWAPARAIDRFWAPVFASSEPVSIYIGGYTTETPPVSLTELQNSERVAFSDATALARVTSWMVAHNKVYRLRLQLAAQIEDLKDGPAILIGGFNNSWTLRLTGQLRYGFARNPEAHVSRIEDRREPGNVKWSHQMDAPYGEVSEDYAIISRVIDPTTGRVVVTASGLAKFGTEAAGEFLSNPVYLERFAGGAPKDWDKKNMQILIATHPVGRAAGPPRVIESYFW